MTREENVEKIAISILGQDEPIIETNVAICFDEKFLRVKMCDGFFGFYPMCNVTCFYITKKGVEHGN